MFKIVKIINAIEDDVWFRNTDNSDKAFIPTDPVGTKFNSLGSIVT